LIDLPLLDIWSYTAIDAGAPRFLPGRMKISDPAVRAAARSAGTPAKQQLRRLGAKV